jgi:acyl-CoA thioesterase-1
MTPLRFLLPAAVLLLALPAWGAEPAVVVALGDSITAGSRPGVGVHETFVSLLNARLKEKSIAAKVVNSGLGGERTDGGLTRLDKAVFAHQPKVVRVMYGTNDSYVDKGKTASRLTVADYRKNLEKLVDAIREKGAEPVLMTEPRWATDTKNGLGENPNDRLEKYLEACRAVAKEKKVRLVDHFAHWTKAEQDGTKVRDWTTDGCHPNPRGHRELADLIWPTLFDALGGGN